VNVVVDDAGLLPALFFAATDTVYVVPGLSPVTLKLVESELVVRVTGAPPPIGVRVAT
jgi:hypothetical protein